IAEGRQDRREGRVGVPRPDRLLSDEVMRSRQTRRLGGFLLGILLLASGGLAYAQFGFGFRGDSNAPARFAPAQFPDSGFVVCRLMYTSVRREPSGGGWRTD